MTRIIPVIITLTLVAANTPAAVILSETFTYPNGSIVGAAGSPWQPNSGTTGSAQVSGGALDWSSSRTEDIVAPLSMTLPTSGAIPAAYSSFNVRFTVLPSQSGAYFAHFTGTTLGLHRGRIWASTANAAEGAFRLGIANSSAGTATTAQWPSDLALNTTYKVVTRYELATGISTLWIDPSSESDPGATAADTPGITEIVYYAFRQNAGIGTSVIDDLRVGTSFDDVAGANNPPMISSIPNQRTPANTPTAPIAFGVGDVETPAASLTLSGSSSDQTLVPDANITFGGSSVNRTVTVTPGPDQQGTATITVVVSDAGGAMASITFQVAVGLPSISDIPNQITPIDTPTPPLSFTVSDAEMPAQNLTVARTSSNTDLVPENNIVIAGNGGTRTVVVTPASGQAGLATITLTVSDGVVSASDTFVLNVFPLLGLLKSDAFNRPDGPLVDGSGAWATHSGTAGQAQLVNGALKLSEDQGEDVNTQLTNAPYLPTSGAILYASFKVTCTELPSLSGAYFGHFKDDGTLNFRCRVFASSTNAAAGSFRLGLANVAGGQSVQFPLDLSLHTPYLVVTRYIVGTGIGTLWVEPRAETDSSSTATDSPSLITVTTYAFRQAPEIGTLCLDDLKVGGAFADVAVTGPRLQISASGNNVQVSWPTTADLEGFRLEFKNDLSTSLWTTVPAEQVSTQGDKKVVQYPDATGSRFFRLFKP